MSGGSRPSGGVLTEDHGHFCPLPRVALALFVCARARADAVGIIPDRVNFAVELGISAKVLQRWLRFLESRTFRARALVKRRGARELWVMLADIPGIPPAPRTFVSVVDGQRTDQRGERPADWTKIRASIGGMQRALREVQEQRDKARREADALRKGKRIEANAALVGLLRDLQHASDCADPNCRRCLAINRAVEAERGEYVTEDELIRQLDRARAIEQRGAAVLRTLRDTSIGAAARRHEALRAFALAITEADL